jgi:hypothetical protein
MGSSFYYLGLAVTSLAIAIYNLSVSSTGSTTQCFNLLTMDQLTYKQYLDTFTANSTSTPGIATNNEDDPNLYDVQTPVSNTFKSIASILGFIYLLITGLSVILSIIINCLSNQLPEDFLNMNRLKKYSAVFCKVIPPILILIHWIALILIFVNWILILTKNCIFSSATTQGVVEDPNFYYKTNLILNIVNSSIWILIHYGGAIFREVVYQEPFMYSPDIGQPNCWKSFFFKKLGP